MAPAALPRLRVAIWALATAFLLVLGVSAALMLGNMRRVALADAQAQVMRFAAVADTGLNSAFQSIDMLLVSTDDLLDLSTLMVGWERGNAISALLRSTLRQTQLISTLALLDARGNVLASSDPDGARLKLQLPEGLLPRVLISNAPGLLVSAPAEGTVSSGNVLYFARYFQLADGARILAVAEVPVHALVSVMAQGVDISGLEVTLERGNGALLLSVPQANAKVVRQRSPSLAQDSAADQTHPVPSWNRPARLSQAPGLVVDRQPATGKRLGVLVCRAPAGAGTGPGSGVDGVAGRCAGAVLFPARRARPACTGRGQGHTGPGARIHGEWLRAARRPAPRAALEPAV